MGDRVEFSLMAQVFQVSRLLVLTNWNLHLSLFYCPSSRDVYQLAWLLKRHFSLYGAGMETYLVAHTVIEQHF
jgi:hypothetical protein